MDYYKFYKDKIKKEYIFSPAAFQAGWALGPVPAKELFEEIATQLKIPFFDECCDEEQQLTVRYDAGSNTLEAYDPIRKDFKTIILGSGAVPFELNLTTLGTSGPSTYDDVTHTLNVPIYSDKFTSNPTMVLPQGFTFGKYKNGDTPIWTGLTAKQAILDAIIGYINPVFTSFSVNQPTVVEVGTTLSGAKIFTWSIDSNSGIINTVDLYNNTTSTTLLSGTPNDGSESQVINTIQLNSDGSTQSWKAIGNNTSPVGIINSNNYIVTSRFYRFFGPTPTSPTDSATVRALPSSDFNVTGDSFILTTGTTETKFVVALPPSRTIIQVLDENSLFANITSEYILTGTINVVDAGGTNRLYNIYEMNLGAPYLASKNHRIYTN